MKPTIVFLLLFLNAAVLAQPEQPVLLSPGKMSNRVLSKRFETVPPKVRGFHAIGTIRVLVYIGPQGDPKKVTMLSGFSHIDFMREYIEREVSSWHFKPLKKNGEYVTYRGVIGIPFYYGSFPNKMP